MTRKERIESDPVYAEEYRRQSRERMRRLYSDPAKYAEMMARRREQAVAKRSPKPPLPIAKACTKCGEVKPATLEFFGSRTAGRLRLHSWCRGCLARDTRSRNAADPKKHGAAVRRSEVKRRAKDPEAFAEARRQSIREYRRRARAEGRASDENMLAYNREWKRANPDRIRGYDYRSPARTTKYAMDRVAAQLRATPAWADQKAIEAIYVEAKRLTEATGIAHHVDHMVPLRGRNVCGLHWEANLRPVPAHVNQKKANKLLDDLEFAA